MKVLMVLDEEFPPDVRVENEILSLADAGHQITLLCYTKDNKPTEDTYGKARIIRIPICKFMYKMKALALSLPFYFRFWKKHIQSVLRQEEFEVLHVHDLPLLKPCLELARQSNVKLVADFHENRPEIMKMYHHVISFPGNMLISVKKWLQYQQDYSALADYLILVTPEARDYYSKEYEVPSEKVYVVPNYTDPDKLLKIKPDKEILDRYKNKIMLSYLGNTGLRRGTHTIIEAAKILRDEPDIHFIIIGESREQEQLQALVDEYALENVELTGYVPFQKAASYIMASSAGLCPFLRNIHHDTTYANKMYQYMAFGKAIIASDCPSQMNVINKEQCGLIFTAGDAAELAEKVLSLKDDKLLERFGNNGKEAVLSRYNTKMGNQALLKLYKNIQELNVNK